MKKKLCKVFKDNGLTITIEANVKNVNFLDINLDLETGVFKPFMKPNDQPVYVHNLSNHPPGILRNIPHSVNRRLSVISANEDVFKTAIPPYQEALKKSGYNFDLTYDPPSPNQQKRCRKRKITYFNPPYSQNVQSNIGEQFFKALDKCFPQNHVLRKVINRNTVKLSYRCMPNIQRKISTHNAKVLQTETGLEEEVPLCNCRDFPCPLDGNCRSTKSVVYKASVLDENGNKETYTGLTKNTFKERYYGHRASFANRDNEGTTLSTHIWNLKDEGKDYNISWSVIEKAPEFNPTTRKCTLCLKEKYHIIFQPSGSTLNSRSELYSTCRHRLSKLLANT